ncbi:AAA family ATPase [Corynebacterium uterequi]|uniref:AAA family ATPase n=1 Tax=Corynebacterium uterequi TaxID=1072256 RepID=UPI0038B34B15
MGSIKQHREQRGGFEQWLYPGLVCDSFTMIQGKAKQGKSLLAANLVASFSTGRSFLGVECSRPDSSRDVLIVGTEANLVAEYGERVTELGGDVDRVQIVPMLPGQELHYVWELKAVYGHLGLVVVDNTSGYVTDEGQNSDTSATVIKRLFQPLVMAGVPVVLIHHFNKSGRSMGSEQYRGMGRFFLDCKRTRDGIRVTRDGGNFASLDPLELSLAGFELSTGGVSASPARRVDDPALGAMARLAVMAPGGNKSAVARYVADRLKAEGVVGTKGAPYSEGAVRQKLRRMEQSENSTLTCGVTLE